MKARCILFILLFVVILFPISGKVQQFGNTRCNRGSSGRIWEWGLIQQTYIARG